MNGGDPILGGGQANPDNTQPSMPGSQPVSSSTPNQPSDSILQISHPTSVSSFNPSSINQANNSAAPQATTPNISSTDASSAQPPIINNNQPIANNSIATSAVPQNPISAAPNIGAPIDTSFDSFSSQSPRPSLPTRNSPFPHSTRPPINPVMPNSMPGVNQPSSPVFPASSQVVFSDAGTASADSSGKGKKIILIVLLLLLVTSGVVAALFATGVLGGSQSTDTSSQPDGVLSTKEEVYDILWDFNANHYSSLIESYNSAIGLLPNFKMSNTDVLFPAESYADIMAQSVDDAINAYEDVSKKLPNSIPNSSISLSEVKESINDSLQAIKQNSNLINSFYDAYIAPIVGDQRPNNCDKTPAMSTLEQGTTQDAAKKYYILYCEALTFVNTTKDALMEPAVFDLQQLVANSASNAADALNNLLVEVPSAVNSLNNLFKEVAE